MMPRERVLMTLDHKEPDRVPICFGNHSVYTIIESPPHGYKALCNYLGVHDYPEPITNLWRNVLNVAKCIRDRFHVDFETITFRSQKPEFLPNNLVRDLNFHGMICTAAGNVYTLKDTLSPFRWAHKEEDIGKYGYWTDFTKPRYYSGLHEEAKTLHDETDMAIIADDLPITFGHQYSFLLGFDRWLLDMKLRPDFYHTVMEKIWGGIEIFTKRYLTEVGDHIDLLMMWDDMGSQTGPLMSVEDFRKFIKPYWERWIKLTRKYTKAKLVIHCCGSVYELYPDFIDMGWDAHHSVQVTARNMEPSKLKKEFGDKICFFGGLDHQKTLPRRTILEIKTVVKDLLDHFAPGGGYIFAPMHDLGAEIPPQNIVAAFDSAFEFGKYPII